MALIKCPECGKDVSSTLKQCIHCGYLFETLEQNKTTVKSQPSNENIGTCASIYNEWKNESLINKLLENSLIQNIPIMVILMAIILIGFLQGRLGIIGTILFFVCFYFWEILNSGIKYQRNARLGVWIKSKQINVVAIADKQLSEMSLLKSSEQEVKEKKAIKRLLASVAFYDEYRIKDCHKTDMIITIIFGFFDNIFISLFVSQFISLIASNYSLLDALESISYFLFFPLVGFSLPLIIVQIVTSTKISNSSKVWVRKNLHNGIDAYSIKIKKLF